MSFFLRRGFYGGSQGQTALSLVLIIGAVITIVGSTLAFLIFSFLNSSFGYQAAQRANAVATAGVEDALLRLVRNKDFGDTAGYSVALGSDAATVSVTQNPGASLAYVSSSAVVSYRRRTLQVIVSITTSTGQVSVVSWKSL